MGMRKISSLQGMAVGFLAVFPVVLIAGSLQLGQFDDRQPVLPQPRVKELLDGGVCQPFYEHIMNMPNPYSDVWANRPRGLWQTVLSPLDQVLLFDYLDANNQPLSLAVPSVEENPMVCSVELLQQGFTIGQKSEESREGDSRKLVETYLMQETAFRSLHVKSSVIFPFKTPDSKRRFTCQCMVKFFLATTLDNSPLRMRGASSSTQFYSPDDWNRVSESEISEQYITLVSRKVALSFETQHVQGPESTIRTVDFDFTPPSQSDLDRFPLYQVTKTFTPYESIYFTAKAQVGFFPFGPNWNSPLKSWRSPNSNLGISDQYAPSYAVWVRIVDDENHTVDLVPATADDDALNGNSGEFDPLLRALGGEDKPLLRFASRERVSYGERLSIAGISGSCFPAAFSVVDPRWNFAPEDFIAQDNPDDDWTEQLKRLPFGKDGWDSDPFMSTSNQGYLQSLSELSNIPMTSPLNGSDGFPLSERATRDGNLRYSYSGIADSKYVWRTYPPNALASWEKEVHGGITESGQIPNADAAVRLLANPPVNWYCAGTNEGYHMDWDAREFLRHSFNGSYGRYDSDDYEMECAIRKIVDTVNEALRYGGSWLEAYDKMDWFHDGNSESVFSTYLGSALGASDRKFLNGYWRGLLLGWQFGPYELIVPDDVYEITDCEYQNDIGLTKVTFGVEDRRSVWIGSKAFAGCTNLTEIVLNRDLDMVGGEVFLGCDALTKIVYGDNDPSVHGYRFSECKNLSNVYVKASSQYFPQNDLFGIASYHDITITIVGDAKNIQFRDPFLSFHVGLVLGEGIEELADRQFSAGYGINAISFPSTLRRIGKNTFTSHSLTKINLPEGLTYIDDSAFGICSGVKNVSIPSTLSYLGYTVFRRIEVENISIASSNPYYQIEDGVLYGLNDGVKRRIVLASRNLPSDYEIPATIQTIDPEAFLFCRNLSTLKVPSSVITINRKNVADHSSDVSTVMTVTGSFVTVPHSWVDEVVGKSDALAAKFNGDYDVFLTQSSGKVKANGYPLSIWEEYVAGTDPADPDSIFKVTEVTFENGVLKVSWEPDLGDDRKYTEYGAMGLGSAASWVDMSTVPDEEKSAYPFRRVGVDMP